MRRIKPIYIVIFVVCFAMGVANSLNSRKASSSTVLPTPQTTLVAIPQIPPKGWTRLEGNGVALQLPDTYMGGNMEDFSAEIIKLADTELPQAKSLFQEAFQNPEKFVLLAFDTKSSPGFLTNVNTVKTRFSSERYPLADIMQGAIKQYPDYIKIVQSDLVKINDIEVIRFVETMDMKSRTSKSLQYIRIDDNNDAWVTNYSTTPDEFDKRLPSFEQSYQSFELLPASK